MPSKRARKIPEKITVFKEEKENYQEKIIEDESLPGDDKISLEELQDQEKTEEDSNESESSEVSDKV